MEAVIEQLLVLQESDRRILQGVRESQDIPKKKDAVALRLQRHRESLEEAREKRQQCQSEIKAIDLEISTARQRIDKLRQQQLELKTNKEFQAMDGEIAGIQEQIQKLEDREIEVMERQDQADAAIARRTDELETAEKRVHGEAVVLDQRLAAIETEVAGVRAERGKLAVHVNPVWLATYDRIFQNKQDFALVGIDHGVCEGCHMKVAPHIIQDAKRMQNIVVCDFCGRMLYVKPY